MAKDIPNDAISSLYLDGVRYNITDDNAIKKPDGGTASQFLKADGSVDSTVYAKNSDLTTHTGNGTIHVTASDKIAWSQKQPLIEDLDAIRSKANSAVQPGDLATVATSGSYNDLSDKPTIPSALASGDAISISSNKINVLVDGTTITKGTDNKLSANFNGLQTTSNLATSLANPDDTHYPSTKAVADALSGAGKGDMLKSTYDPNNVGKNVYDYDNFINTPTIPTNVSQLNNDSGYLTSFTETDPTVASYIKAITETDISNWNNKGTYSKPSGGIPATDLSSDVQTSLSKIADAVLKSSTGMQTIATSGASQTSALKIKTNNDSSLLTFENSKGSKTLGINGDNKLVFDGSEVAGNGKITINAQITGKVGEFTVNQSGDTTITIPIGQANKPGLVAGGNWLTVNQETGKMEAGELTLDQYNSANGKTFVGKTTLENRLVNKQDTISDLETIRNNASSAIKEESDPTVASYIKAITESDISSWNSKGTYSKPEGGIPATDMATEVQQALSKITNAVVTSASGTQTIQSTAASQTTPLKVKSNNASSLIAIENTTGTKTLGIDANSKLVFNGKDVAMGDDVVHLAGTETISGSKQFDNIVKYTSQQNYYAHNQGPTSPYAYGVYQWGNQMQYTLRDANSDGWLKTVFGLDPDKMEVTGNLNVSGNIYGNAVGVNLGTSAQFMKADGSLDSNTYQTFISDLADIRSGAAKGATALQSIPLDKIYSTLYEAPAYQVGMWFSDLTPAVSADNPPKVGEYFRTPRGNVYQIVNVNVTGDASTGGGTFDCGQLINQFVSRTGQLTNDSGFMSTPAGGTTGDVIVKTDSGIAWGQGGGAGDMAYADFNFSDKTGTAIELSLSTNITPTGNITINKPSEIKVGQTYILRCNNSSTAYSLTLGTGITNPFNTNLTLTPNSSDMFVFFAINDTTLELQPMAGDKFFVYLTQDEYDDLPDSKYTDGVSYFIYSED